MFTGLGIDEFFQRSDVNGAQSFVTDQLQSTLALTNSLGSVATSYTYEPFGNVSISPPQTNTNPYQFSGRENDGSGLDYYRAKYYSPGEQRFISQDPLEFNSGQMNLYSYASADPVDYSDALGLYSEMCHRNIFVPVPYAQHCFVRFNGDAGDTLSFDNRGTGKDWAPNHWPYTASCKKAGPDDRDKCIRNEMNKCGQYDFFGNNCCHCVEQAFKACGVGFSPNDWPNWPINPGPQPGEQP